MFNDPSRSRRNAQRGASTTTTTSQADQTSATNQSSSESSQQPSTSQDIAGAQQTSLPNIIPSTEKSSSELPADIEEESKSFDTKSVIPSSSDDAESSPCDNLETSEAQAGKQMAEEGESSKEPQEIKSTGEKEVSKEDDGALAGTSTDDGSVSAGNLVADGYEEESNDDSDPGKLLMKKGFQSIETDLRSLRKDFIDKNKMEPVVNLRYDAKGASSGVISVDVPDMLERTHITSTDESGSHSSEQMPEPSESVAEDDPQSISAADPVISSSPSTSLAPDCPETGKGEGKAGSVTSAVDQSKETSNNEAHSEPEASNFSHGSSVHDISMESDTENEVEISSDDEMNEEVITAMHDRIVHSTR